MAGTEKQREEINRKLVSMQMEMIGKTYDDAMNTPEFWRVYTLTTEQNEEWRKKALLLIKKTFKINSTKARSIMDFFELQLGLRVYDPPKPTTYYIHKPTLWQKIKNFFKSWQ
jgi:predicted metallo-beta-lactamase superfamily hydrolase